MIVGILQARVSSSRLPGKVLMPILGKPMLLWQIERLKRAKFIDRLIVATSNDLTDDPIDDLCFSNTIDCFRGSLDNVLDRFYRAASFYNANHVVRLTGDCPLADPFVIDNVINYYLSDDFDYVSNATIPTFPDGLDVEVFSFSALEQSWYKAQLLSEKEHVTSFIAKHKELFKLGLFRNNIDLSHLRWTVDELDDFDLIVKIYENLNPISDFFSMENVLCFLDRNPELKTYNTHYKRNEGYMKSLKKDF